LNWDNLLLIFVLSIAIFIVYSLTNLYFLSKLKVSKWVVLGASLVFLAIGLVLPAFSNNMILNYIPTAIFVFLFLWYADLSGLSNIGAPKKKGPVGPAIKPKAKPNKLKYTDEKDILKTSGKEEKNRLFKKKK